MIRRHLYDEFLRCNVIFYTNCKLDTARKSFYAGYRLEYKPEQGGEPQGRFSYEQVGNQRIYFVWVRSLKDVSTVVHEAVHLAMRIFDSKGIVVDVDHDEPLAYYVEMFTKFFLKGKEQK